MFWVSSVFLLCLLHRIASGKVSFTLVCYEHPDGNLEKYCFGFFSNALGFKTFHLFASGCEDHRDAS